MCLSLALRGLSVNHRTMDDDDKTAERLAGSSMRRLVLRLCLCLAVLLPASCSDPVDTAHPDPVPYPRLDSAIYAKCGAPGCWSLETRDEAFLLFEGATMVPDTTPPLGACFLRGPNLILPPPPQTLRGVCGELIFGVDTGVARSEMERTLDLLDGDFVRWPEDAFGSGKIRVPVGTELAGIRKTVYNPALRFIVFNLVGGTASLQVPNTRDGLVPLSDIVDQEHP